LNSIGLKRAGMADSEARELKRAFRLLCRTGTTLKDTLAQLATFEAPSVAELARFIETSSRGFAHCR